MSIISAMGLRASTFHMPFLNCKVLSHHTCIIYLKFMYPIPFIPCTKWRNFIKDIQMKPFSHFRRCWYRYPNHKSCSMWTSIVIAVYRMAWKILFQSGQVRYPESYYFNGVATKFGKTFPDKFVAEAFKKWQDKLINQ